MNDRTSYGNKPKSLFRKILELILIFAIASFIIVLMFNALILIYTTGIVAPNTVQASEGTYLFIITPLIIPIIQLKGYIFLSWYVFIVAAIILSLFWLWKEGTSSKLKKSRYLKLDTYPSLVLLSKLFLAILFFSFAYIFLLWLIGVELKTPSFEEIPLWKLFYGLANAAVYEELITRMLFIGLPLMVINIFVDREFKIKRLFGGNIRITSFTVLLILFSSGMFAFAHWLSSWGFWKVPETFVTGCVLGYLFLRIGIHACIVFHFATNYLSVSTLLLNSSKLTLSLGLLVLFWAFVGMYYFVVYLVKLYAIIFRPEISRASLATSTSRMEYKPTVYLTPGLEFGYRCEVCGYTEGRYLGDGVIECLHCGSKTTGSKTTLKA